MKVKLKNALNSIYDHKECKKLEKLLKDFKNGKIDKIKTLEELYNLLRYYQHIYKIRKYNNDCEFYFNNINVIIDCLNDIYKTII